MKKQLFSSALLLLAAQTMASTPATVAYVDAADSQIITEIESKGGTVGQLDCQKNNPPPSSDATVAYVDECDNELNAAISSIPSGGSRYTVGDAVCGTDAHTCTGSETPWGIVIYADPNPQASGHGGIAISVKDIVVGSSGGSSMGIKWGSDNASCSLPDPNCTAVTGADDYSIYGGRNNTDAINTWCTITHAGVCGSDSAFNQCNAYDDGINPAGSWYLPSIAEMTLMFTYAQTESYPGLPVEQFKSYYYWSSTQWSGSEEASDKSQISYSQNSGAPASVAFIFDVLDGYQYNAGKTLDNVGVRCAQALPI